MRIPREAIKQGAHVLRTYDNGLRREERDAMAESVIEAAMPAIREHIAQEIEAAETFFDYDQDGEPWIVMAEAARIVRGGAA